MRKTRKTRPSVAKNDTSGEQKKTKLIDFENIKPFQPDLPEMDGKVHNYMGTATIYGLINALAAQGHSYLEIGSYRGCSLAAAAKGNSLVKCIGIDNFTGVGYRKENKAICEKVISKYPNAELINEDYEAAIPKLDRLFDCIFIDGPHSLEHTRKQLNLTSRLLKPWGWIVIDDFNSSEIQKATNELLQDNPSFQLVFEKKTKAKNDPIWWNGVAVIRYVGDDFDNEK